MDRKQIDELILYCLVTKDDEATKATRFEQLLINDWEEIILRSAKYRVGPLLYSRLKTDGYIPAEVMRRLKRIYLANAMKNVKLYNELSKLLTMLQDDGISVIVLKGAAIAEAVYQNIALRPMSDIDLLVKGKDIWRVDGALLQLGYKSHTCLFSKWYAQWIQHIEYSKRVFRIEVHPNRIFEMPNLDLWINASPVEIASADALILGSEDFLLHLCTHLDRHLHSDGISSLIWWYDIAELLKHYQKDLKWDYVIKTAKEHKVQGCVRRVLHVINSWIDGCIPADVLGQLKSNSDIISIGDVMDLSRISMARQDQNKELDPTLSFMSKIPRIHDKIHYLFIAIFPCREFILCRYSVAKPELVYFYYFRHIGEIVKRIAKALYRILFQKNEMP